ncbi:MAG: DNA polymerase I [Candidatus Dormibacteria bacterium]
MAQPGAQPTRLLLIDGHGLAFRAYHALPEMTNSHGVPIRVAYGYTSMLLLALGQGYDCAVAAFDPPGPTFRDQKLATYKAHRAPTPQELIDQIPVLGQITNALNIPTQVVPGFEADDVLGTLAKQARELGCRTTILTGDMDLIQLVDEVTSVQTSRRGASDPVVYDPEAVKARYGFPPERMVDFKALRGDASDNIPGVPGIGEKTATLLIQQFGDLDSILAAVATMPPGRVRTTLEANREEALFGREMVTIVRDVPGVQLDLTRCRLSEYDRAGARQLLEELGMPSLAARLPASAGSKATAALASSPVESEVVESRERLQEVVSELARGGVEIAIRVLADGPSRLGRVVALALAAGPSRGYLVPFNGTTADAREPLRLLLAEAGAPKASYNFKEDLLALEGAGWSLRGVDFDLVLAGYLSDSRGRTPSLSTLAREHGGLTAPEPPSTQETLAAEAACVAAVVPGLRSKLREAGGEDLLRTVELPVAAILAGMERAGVRLDSGQLEALSAELHTQIAALEAEMFRLAGREFLPGSPQQLATILYDELGLRSSRRTKTGRSTDAHALEGLRDEHPLVPLILEWRQVTKLKSTYVDQLPALVDPQDGRVHTSFNQAVAATGRLSSSDPNLQNIPVRTELGRRIRAAFIPGEEGWELVSADYSQIELRLLAHLSRDPELLAAFGRGDDIHADTAARVFRVEREQVTPDQRRMAKVVNFGVLYGLSSYGLARDLGMPPAEAEEFITRYFATYAGVGSYLEGVREEARVKGYVSTLLGRRRYLPEITSSNRQVREANERMAINMPLQGSAADLMKLGMIEADRALRSQGLRAQALLQVHDELLLEAPPEEVAAVASLARTAMEGVMDLAVPLVVELKSGPNWRDLAPLRIARQ